MRFYLIILMILSVTGCSSPGAPFQNVNPVTVTVDDSTFEVFISDNNARVIRTSFEMLPDMTVIAVRAITAIDSTSGCRVIENTLTGDQAMIDAKVRC